MNGTPINGTPISGTSTNGLESQFITTTTSDCGTYGDNCSGYYGWRVDDVDSTVPGTERSSYLFNFVTPVVRQIRIRDAKDYVYEVCDTGIYTDCNSTTTDPKHWTITAVADASYSATATNAWRNNGNAIEGQAVTNFRTGSFSTDPDGRWANFPRRVAFKRDNSTGALVSPLNVYGVNSSGNIAAYAVSSTSSIRAVGGTNNNLIPALELDSNGQWRPILWNSIVSNSNENNSTDWFQPATSTIYNVIIASGDTPARTTEDNGGLHNYVRFAESWTGVNAKISGSFMQLRKSSYATAPFATSLTNPNDDTLRYATNNGGNRLPFYQPPVRLWGYDVGILSQSPDLFSQKLVVPVGDLPNEYFREVGRDDPWVQNLLCAKDDANTSYVIDQNQRPSICQS
jgi:hypothetical protein